MRSLTRSLYLRYCKLEASSLYRCKDVLGSDVRAIRAVESGQPALPNTERDDGGKEARSTRNQDASGHSHTGLCSELRHLYEYEGI